MEAKGDSDLKFHGSEKHKGALDTDDISSQTTPDNAKPVTPVRKPDETYSSPIPQLPASTAVTASQTDIEAQLAELTLSKSQTDQENRDLLTKYHTLLTDHNRLLSLYRSADRDASSASDKVDALETQLDQTHQQLLKESNARKALAKDNHLLRSQITEMSSAQEPLREERYYVLEFMQIRMDIESLVAKETRNSMSKQSLSEQECAQLVQILKTCGDTGISAAEWFDKKELSRGWQDRRSRIYLIRHFIAAVLFDHVFERFAFGFDRVWSKYFTDMEKLICKNGNYPLTKILMIRQAIGQSVVTLQSNTLTTFRTPAINTLVRLLQLLLPSTPAQRIQAFGGKILDKSIQLKTAMTEEQAIYRCDFFDGGDDFDDAWMESDPNDSPARIRSSGRSSARNVSLCGFPCLRRFTTDMVERQWIQIVKASVKLSK